jgi:hypothetical protein
MVACGMFEHGRVHVVDEQHLKRVSFQTAHGFLLVLTTLPEKGYSCQKLHNHHCIA